MAAVDREAHQGARAKEALAAVQGAHGTAPRAIARRSRRWSGT